VRQNFCQAELGQAKAFTLAWRYSAAFGLNITPVVNRFEAGMLEDFRPRQSLNGALTLVVTPKVILAEWVGDAQASTVGLRVPDHPVLLELLAEVGPLAVTSANEAGEAETVSDVEAREVFGDRVAVYLEGIAPGGEASTVVDVSGAHPVVLRRGPVVL
jgi:tRNA A37 threonylcarbamoyladenosine synthetase subunit TsaC/SUA5/YrdC